MVRTARETRTPLAMLVLDVDRLKSINDTYGHLAGAEAVRLVGHTLATHLPPGAVACRYGGDEFAIAVANCDEARGRTIAEELCREVRALEPVLAEVAFPVRTLSISVGLACVRDDHVWGHASSASDVQTGRALFAAADQGLYVAKKQGRNRVNALVRHS
jgi:diguanylate cyclase (GGDEF)-like protein